MQFFSQRDPEFGSLNLGTSKLTVHGYGCFAISVVNIYQKTPLDILKLQGVFDSGGNLLSSVAAKNFGGVALPATNIPPKGWCIGVTDRFAPQFPTHFLLVNIEAKLQIDPLDYPVVVEPLSYRIIQYRPFTNIALPPGSFTMPPPLVFPDVPADRWSVPFLTEAKQLGIIGGYPDGTFKPTQPITREEAVALVMKSRKV